MMSIPLRTVTFILLLVSLLGFSGAVEAGLLLVEPVSVGGDCCPATDNELPGEPSAPCSTLECQCPVCFGVLLQGVIRIDEPAPAGVAVSLFKSAIPPSGFTPNIEYPPEFV